MAILNCVYHGPYDAGPTNSEPCPGCAAEIGDHSEFIVQKGEQCPKPIFCDGTCDRCKKNKK